MSQFLVILRGAHASGKTTISKKLRDFEKKIAWLKVDNFKDFFAEDSSIALRHVNGSAIATLSYLLKQGFSVVMDGVFQDIGVIDQAIQLANEEGVKVIVYQIQCPLTTLQERDRTRPGIKEGCRKQLGDDVIAQIYYKLENSYYPNAVTLDTEKLSLEECIQKIRDDLRKGKR